MRKLRVGKCDYDCEGKNHGKGRGRGYRVHCKKTDKKCEQKTTSKVIARITDPKKAIEILIETGGGHAKAVAFELERLQDRKKRTPHETFFRDWGFKRKWDKSYLNYSLEIEFDPQNPPKLASKKVLQRWVEEKIFVVVDGNNK